MRFALDQADSYPTSIPHRLYQPHLPHNLNQSIPSPIHKPTAACEPSESAGQDDETADLSDLQEGDISGTRFKASKHKKWISHDRLEEARMRWHAAVPDVQSPHAVPNVVSLPHPIANCNVRIAMHLGPTSMPNLTIYTPREICQLLASISCLHNPMHCNSMQCNCMRVVAPGKLMPHP